MCFLRNCFLFVDLSDILVGLHFPTKCLILKLIGAESACQPGLPVCLGKNTIRVVFSINHCRNQKANLNVQRCVDDTEYWPYFYHYDQQGENIQQSSQGAQIYLFSSHRTSLWSLSLSPYVSATNKSLPFTIETYWLSLSPITTTTWSLPHHEIGYFWSRCI